MNTRRRRERRSQSAFWHEQGPRHADDLTQPQSRRNSLSAKQHEQQREGPRLVPEVATLGLERLRLLPADSDVSTRSTSAHARNIY